MDVEASPRPQVLANVVMKKGVSVIIVNYKGFDLTSQCVKSLRVHSPQTEIIIVDNASRDRSVERLRELFPDITIVEMNGNNGFGSANNAGAVAASGSHLFFLNNDTIVHSDSPQHLSSVLQREQKAAVVGPRLSYEDGSFQLSFGFDPSPFNEWKTKRMQKGLFRRDAKLTDKMQSRYASVTPVDWVTGAALMIRREVFESIGGFDEAYFMYFEDADLCQRVRKKGWDVLYDPAATIMHYGGGSVASNDMSVYIGYRRSQLRYYRKHGTLLSNVALRVYLTLMFGFRWMIEATRGGNRMGAMKEILRHVRNND